MPDTADKYAVDKLVIDTLKEVHNRGADLYNAGDPAGCYRMYEGALAVARPFVAHHPSVIKIIDQALAEVAKTDGVKIQAFRLHEVIEQVRAELKVKVKRAAEKAAAAGSAPVAPPPTREVPTAGEPMPHSPADTVMLTQRPVTGLVRGKLTLAGEPLANAEVTFVSLTLALPRVVTTATAADGLYAVTGLPAGEYAVMVTAAGAKLPSRFQSTATSELRATTGGTSDTVDLSLQP